MSDSDDEETMGQALLDDNTATTLVKLRGPNRFSSTYIYNTNNLNTPLYTTRFSWRLKTFFRWYIYRGKEEVDPVIVTVFPGHVYFGEPGPGTPKIWRDKFLYSKTKLGMYFTVDEVEYRLSGTYALLLRRSDAAHRSPPLAVFKTWSKTDRGKIVINAEAIAERELDPPQDCLLVAGKPTNLLDYALLAESLYRQNQG